MIGFYFLVSFSVRDPISYEKSKHFDPNELTTTNSYHFSLSPDPAMQLASTDKSAPKLNLIRADKNSNKTHDRQTGIDSYGRGYVWRRC